MTKIFQNSVFQDCLSLVFCVLLGCCTLQSEVKKKMHSVNSDHLFLDISTIDCRDTNISFSVEHLLNNQYYPSKKQQHPQKIHNPRHKDTPSRHNHKGKEPNTPKSAKKQGNKVNQRQSRLPSKQRDVIDERDTNDNSQTVKIVRSKPNLKEMPVKKTQKQSESHTGSGLTASSNKFQPTQQTRSRSKSNASLHANRRWSQNKQDFVGKAVSSNISLTRNPSLQKMRSQTNKRPTEQVKAKNEYIVRNDYFDENTEKNEGKINNDSAKQKTTSVSKKIVTFTCKKTKKSQANQGASSSQWQKFNPKSPRLKK